MSRVETGEEDRGGEQWRQVMAAADVEELLQGC